MFFVSLSSRKILIAREGANNDVSLTSRVSWQEARVTAFTGYKRQTPHLEDSTAR